MFGHKRLKHRIKELEEERVALRDRELQLLEETTALRMSRSRYKESYDSARKEIGILTAKADKVEFLEEENRLLRRTLKDTRKTVEWYRSAAELLEKTGGKTNV